MQPSLFKYSHLISAKRTAVERRGVHNWHSYYAGYAEQFVESALDYLKIDTSDLLLDPWNGSGTTALIAGRRGIRSIGLDVNPVMNIFSMAKTGVVINNKSLIISAADKLSEDLASSDFECSDDDALLDFMSPSLCSGVRVLYKLVSTSKISSPCIKQGINNIFKTAFDDCYNPIKHFLVAGLFITARQAAGYKGGSNPTWVKTLDEKPIVRKKTLAKQFQKNIQKMLEDLSFSGVLPCNEIIHLAINGDSRKIPLKNSSINHVITSPPYLTRIDYAMSTRPELLIIGDEINLRRTRELTMGSPVIVDKTIQANPIWGKICNSLLDAVENHTSKASRSYYLPNMLQYFRDAELSLKEIVRILKPGGKALIVVQSSYFKEHEIPLGQIYLEMCKELPVKAKISFKEMIKGHMAHVNTKSTQYKKDKVFYEDVVEIEKS